MVEAADATHWRSIDELARMVGAYCWAEKRIFECTGSWATGAGAGAAGALPPEARVWCAAVSRRHGLLAARWAERLPVRAGVDRAALVQPTPGGLHHALQALDAAPDLAALVGTVLPLLRDAYAAHLRSPNPVSEAPVLEVLADALRDLAAEVGDGAALVEGTPTG